MTREQRLASVRRARERLKAASGFDPQGGHYIAVLAELRLLEKEFLPAPAPALPALGPVYPGGPSILDEDFTHMTSNLGWPAVDAPFGANRKCIAPEDIIVDTKDSSANPGEAFYATGKSGIRYWFAHLHHDWPLGKRIAKGEEIGTTIPTNIGGGPHMHYAVDIRPLTGRHARYGANGDGPNYTHGPYTLRKELLR